MMEFQLSNGATSPVRPMGQDGNPKSKVNLDASDTF